MAWRHFSSKKRKTGLSLMTIISFMGVTIGVMALVIVLSVMGGFEEDLRKKMFRGLPHFEVLSENALAGFSLNEHSLKKFKDHYKEADRLEPFTRADVVLKQRRHLASITLFGVDPQLGGKVWGFGSAVVEGSMESLLKKHSSIFDVGTPPKKWPGIILGEDLAVQLGVGLGEDVTILSPQAGVQDALSGGTISSRYVVSGIFKTDLPQFDSKYAVVSIPEGRKFMPDYDESLDEDRFVTGVAINFQDPEQVDLYADTSEKFPGLKNLTWKIVNKSLLFALKLEKFTMGSILLLIVVVAAFSISGTMMMTVFHKRQQISLLRALGMSRNDITRLFIVHGFTIGTVGIFLGLLLGVAVCAGIYYFKFLNLPDGIYYHRQMPVKFLPLDYIVISFCAWTLSLVAAIYPALVASRQDPGMGLRFR